jgi:hypothetical protein
VVKTFKFFCGGRAVPSGTEGNVISLDVQGTQQNVKLKIEDISKGLMSNIPDVILDLIEVASYVYCADQKTKRGSELLTDMGSDWRRDMHFSIPVRCPDLWNKEATIASLRDTLSFLSDDTYTFEFVPAMSPLAEKQLYIDFTDHNIAADDVALFSGGVDSFSGALDALVGEKKKMVLVGHHSAVKVSSVQKELIQALKDRGLANQIHFVSIEVTNKGEEPVEYTQRTRSFLFACLGMAIAHMFGKDSFTFYENGVVSLNIPIAKDVLGARATRTTHPKVIRGFESIFSEVLGKPITVKTPYQWMTKKEVTLRAQEHGFSDLMGVTNSCTRPRSWTQQHRHCGICSQCIDRRFAMLAAYFAANDDGAKYKVDLLVGDRSADREITMAASYVRFAQDFQTLSKNQFLSKHPQITSALSSFPGMTVDEAEEKVYQLYKRHAADVMGVVNKGFDDHRARLVDGTLPSGCILSMCFNRNVVEPTDAPDIRADLSAFMDRLQPQKCEFAVDHTQNRVVFKGSFFIDGADFNLVNALIPNFRSAKQAGTDHGFVRAPDLATTLGIEEASLRKQLERTRKKVHEKLAVDQGIVFDTDGFIENKEREGYRLNASLREVALADLDE